MAKRITIKASNGMKLTCIVYRASKTTKWFGSWKYAHKVVIRNEYGDTTYATFYNNNIEPSNDEPIEVLDCIFDESICGGSYDEEEYYREFGYPYDYPDNKKAYIGCKKRFDSMQRLGFTINDMYDTINIIRNIINDEDNVL